MADEICIFHEGDSEPLAKFLQDKLSSDDMSIDTCLCTDLRTTGDKKCKVNIFLISPEFLQQKKLHIVKDFNEKNSALVLVGSEYSGFEQEVINQDAESLLEWFVFHLEETDESVKELLVSIISIYELGSIPEDSSENDTEDESGTGISQTESIEYHNISDFTEKADARNSDYIVLPPRSSLLSNAVKHVFRKDGKVFILLERVAGGKLDVKFHENGKHILPVFASNVYSYVFHWTGTERETFTVKFKEEQIGNGKIDASSGDTPTSGCINDNCSSVRYSTDSASSSSTASECDDSPYDILPTRRRNTVIHITLDNTVPNICRDLSPNTISSTTENDVGDNFSLNRLKAKHNLSVSTSVVSDKAEPTPLPNVCSNTDTTAGDFDDEVLQAGNHDSDDNLLGRRSDSDSGSNISHSHSTDTLCSDPCSNESEFTNVALHTDADENADNAQEGQIITPPSKRHQHTCNKLKLLRALLEDEITHVSSRINSEAEDHNVVLRHPRTASGMTPSELDNQLPLQSEGDRKTIINEEPSDGPTDPSVAKDHTHDQTQMSHEQPSIDKSDLIKKSCEQTLIDSSDKTQTLSQQNFRDNADETLNPSKRSSDDAVQSEASVEEEMITFKCDTRTDDDPGFGTAKIPEIIPETAKQDLPAPEVDVQSECKPGKKSKFSFKKQIKKIVQRSKSEPKLRQVLEVAQKHEKNKLFQSYIDSGAGEVLAHSASATGFRELKENSEETLYAEKSTKKKKKAKKSSATDMKRPSSLRIQRVLEDNSLTAPTLPGRLSEDSF